MTCHKQLLLPRDTSTHPYLRRTIPLHAAQNAVGEMRTPSRYRAGGRPVLEHAQPGGQGHSSQGQPKLSWSQQPALNPGTSGTSVEPMRTEWLSGELCGGQRE